MPFNLGFQEEYLWSPWFNQYRSYWKGLQFCLKSSQPTVNRLRNSSICGSRQHPRNQIGMSTLLFQPSYLSVLTATSVYSSVVPYRFTIPAVRSQNGTKNALSPAEQRVWIRAINTYPTVRFIRLTIHPPLLVYEVVEWPFIVLEINIRLHH